MRPVLPALIPALLLSLACGPAGGPGGDTAAADPPDEDLDPRVILGEPQPCDAPRPPGWREAAGDVGLPPGPDPDVHHLDGGGVAIEDLDGDGDLDLVTTWEKQAAHVCMNQDGHFSCTTTSPEGERLPGGGPPVLADLDGDGDLDLAVGGPGASLLRQDDDGWRPLASLADLVGDRAKSLGPADFDGDGDVDLYVGMTAPGEDAADRTDVLLWNQGDGSFVADANSWGAPGSTGKAFQPVILDWEVDGDPDVYVVNDFGPEFGGNTLLRNDGGTFTVADEACDCALVHAGMGAHPADRNGDGRPDLYVAAAEQNILLDSDGGDGFIDVTVPTGADPLDVEDMAWGSAFVDHDNDGDLDLAVAEGDLWAEDYTEGAYEAPARLLSWDEEAAAFVDVSEALGLSTTGSHRGVVAVDLNEDGLLDLLYTDVATRARLYLSDGCTAAGWLAVRAPPGSRVEVEVDGVLRTAWASRESGFAARGPAIAWFGLGEAQEIDALDVTLPWTGETLSVAGPLPARRTITVTP